MLSLSSVGLTTTTTLQAQAPAQLDATTAQQLDHYGLPPPSVFKSAANLCVNRPHHLRPKTQMSTKAKTAALQQIRFSESPDLLLFSMMSKTTAQTSGITYFRGRAFSPKNFFFYLNRILPKVDCLLILKCNNGSCF